MKHFLHTLGLREEASWNEIREAYKDQMRVWHPDRFANDKKLQEKAEEQTKQINYALRRLKELKSDLPQAGFNSDSPFLKQYYLKTNGGKGLHAAQTTEDSSEGYNNRSFAMWSGVISKATIKKSQGVDIGRARKKTVVIFPKNLQRNNRSPLLQTFVFSSLAFIFASIGVAHLPSFATQIKSTKNNKPLLIEAEKNLLKKITKREERVGNSIPPKAKLASIQRPLTETRSPLINATMNCDIGLLQMASQDSSLINKADSSGKTALIWAAKRNCSAAVKILLSKGADPTIKSSNGFTALEWAKWYHNYDSIVMLNKMGVRK
jgi:DnaJ domain/Ankyrin repeats (3 copies)